GATAARATLDELAAMLDEIEARSARLPAAARSQADQVRAAVEQGVEALMEQARRTAQEAQAIDAAFQDRVRRNFDMLSDAVRLMGNVAVTPPPSPPAPAPRSSAPLRPPEPPIVEPEPLELADLTEDEPEPDDDGLGDELILRQRLRLTPTATD